MMMLTPIAPAVSRFPQTDVSRGAQSKDVLPTSKGELKKDAENASVHLRTLLTLILTNSEARKVISDLVRPPFHCPQTALRAIARR